MSLLKFFKPGMGVYLSCTQACMAEQFLDSIELGAMIEQVRGISMAQYVRALSAGHRFARQGGIYNPVNQSRIGILSGIGNNKEP